MRGDFLRKAGHEGDTGDVCIREWGRTYTVRILTRRSAQEHHLRIRLPHQRLRWNLAHVIFRLTIPKYCFLSPKSGRFGDMAAGRSLRLFLIRFIGVAARSVAVIWDSASRISLR